MDARDNIGGDGESETSPPLTGGMPVASDRAAATPNVVLQGSAEPTGGGTRRIPRWLLGTGSTLLLAAALWWVVLPQFGGAMDTLQSLEQISFTLVLVAGALELASLASYSVLTASILGSGRPHYFTILRVDLSGLAVNHVVPGGGATAAAARFHLLQRAGVGPANALSAAAIEVTVSNLVLGGLFALGLLLSITTVAANGYYRTATIAALAALLATGFAGWFLTQRTDWTVQIVRSAAGRIPFLNADSAEAFLRMMALQVGMLGRSPRRMGVDILFAAFNWLLDAAALWVLLAALGHPIGLGPLLTVYALGNILATLPLTPGGLGIVEGVMAPALVGFGIPAEIAVLGVIGWRLYQFWLPLPLGALAYLSLRLGPLRRGRGETG